MSCTVGGCNTVPWFKLLHKLTPYTYVGAMTVDANLSKFLQSQLIGVTGVQANRT
jgi:hypothetical protein